MDNLTITQSHSHPNISSPNSFHQLTHTDTHRAIYILIIWRYFQINQASFCSLPTQRDLLFKGTVSRDFLLLVFHESVSGACGKLVHEKTRSRKSRDTVPLGYRLKVRTSCDSDWNIYIFLILCLKKSIVSIKQTDKLYK